MSRTLTYLLRHGAEKEGLAMDASGFVRVRELMRRPDLDGLDEVRLRSLVSSCPKQRFELKEGEPLLIRASQGHSLKCIDEDLVLRRMTLADLVDFPVVVHGTTTKAWTAIQAHGLSRMTRLHIHFATGLPGASGLISGMRHSCDVFIHLDLARALADDLRFYVSTNKVLLSPGNEDGFILPQYFSCVHDRNGAPLAVLHRPAVSVDRLCLEGALSAAEKPPQWPGASRCGEETDAAKPHAAAVEARSGVALLS